MSIKSSTKLVLAAAALVVAFASVEASAAPIVIPKGPIKIAPKGPIIVKPLLPKGPIIVKPLPKPPVIVIPKFPKKPPIIVVTPKFPKPVIVSPVIVQRPLVRPVHLVQRPVVTTCNCLTKEYTQDGQVLFKDLCTQEMAMAPVPGVEPQKSSEAQPSTNYAGKTYQDYLAANGAQQQN